MEYSMYMDAAYVGNVVDSQPSVIRTYSAKEVISAGTLVSRAELGGKIAKKFGGATDEILGIVIRNIGDINDSTEGFKPKSPLAVISFGSIWVSAESDVKAGQSVFVRVVATGDQKIGALTAVEDSTKTNTPKLLNAKFISSASAGGIVELEILGNLELKK